MLTNLQAVRALAAIGVVVFHFGLMPGTQLPFQVGAAGVDLFFVLSGFIIAHSAARSRRHFLAHRLIRVLPPYWIATAIAGSLAGLVMGSRVWGWIGRSMLFLPGPGGRPMLIFVGWTLTYELGFYLLYWAALRFGSRRAPFVALALLLALAFLPLPGGAGPWPLLIEFAMGVAAFLVTETARSPRLRPRSALLLAAAGLVLLPLLPRLTTYDPEDYRSVARVLTWGLPASLVILGVVWAEQGGWAVRSRPILLLGAASYAIYLLHPIAIGLLMALPPAAGVAGAVSCIIATTLVVVLSMGFHLGLEAPLLRRLRGLLHDRPPVEQSL